MNIRELQSNETQPHWWMFLAISVPSTGLMSLILLFGKRYWRKYRIEQKGGDSESGNLWLGQGAREVG